MKTSLYTTSWIICLYILGQYSSCQDSRFLSWGMKTVNSLMLAPAQWILTSKNSVMRLMAYNSLITKPLTQGHCILPLPGGDWQVRNCSWWVTSRHKNSESLSWRESCSWQCLSSHPVIQCHRMLKERKTVRRIASWNLWKKLLSSSMTSPPFTVYKTQEWWRIPVKDCKEEENKIITYISSFLDPQLMAWPGSVDQGKRM